MPDIQVDFTVFKPLNQLEALVLKSVHSISANKKRQKLTNKHLDQLTQSTQLDFLELTHFDLNSIDEHTLSVFKHLLHLDLTDNAIAHIHEEAFNNCPSPLGRIVLKGNQIAILPKFTTQSLVHELSLESNMLQSLSTNSFNGLEKLQQLNLKDTFARRNLQ